MNINYLVMVTLLCFSGVMANTIATNNTENYATTQSQKKAITFLIYSSSFDDFLSQTPSYQGDAIDKISLPEWLGKDKDIKTYAESGKGYIYTSNTQGLMSELMQETDNSTKLGVSTASQIITNTGGVPKPAYIPNNYLVYIR